MSHKLWSEPLKRKQTKVDLNTAQTQIFQLFQVCVHSPDLLVSYIKKEKNLPHKGVRVFEQEHQIPEIIMDYNPTEGRLDDMGKLVNGYSCKMRTLRYTCDMFQHLRHPSVKCFHHLDISKATLEHRKAPEQRIFSRSLARPWCKLQMRRRQIQEQALREEQEDDAFTNYIFCVCVRVWVGERNP